MPGGYPSPFGRGNAADPRAIDAAAPGARAWPTFTGKPSEEAEQRRRAAGHGPRTDAEVMEQAWARPVQEHTPWPQVGQRVGFVREEWGRVEGAVILQVESPNEDDPNINTRVMRASRFQGKKVELVPRVDPMPWVILQTDDGFVTKTRESRVRGACGWSPA